MTKNIFLSNELNSKNQMIENGKIVDISDFEIYSKFVIFIFIIKNGDYDGLLVNTLSPASFSSA